MSKTRELLPVEQEIISLFYPKNKRKRIRYELSKVDLNNQDSISDFQWRNMNDIGHFNLKNFHAEKAYPSKTELRELAGNTSVYYMGCHYYGWLSAEEAWEKAFESDVCLIYLGNGVAWYQGEQFSANGIGAAPERFMLTVKKG